jgi:hypothetical protein
MVGGEQYPIWRFGGPDSEFTKWLIEKRAECRRGEEFQVWITSLCSYWFESVAQTCRWVKQTLPEARVVLLGQYPRLMPEHAAENCAADFVMSESLDLDDEPASLDLYQEDPPPFLSLRLAPKVAISDLKDAVKRQVFRFTFFEDDICGDKADSFAEIVRETAEHHKNLRYHLICGLNPARMTPALACLLANKKFAEIHFEEANNGDGLDLEAYRRARAYLIEAGLEMPNDRVSGFVWIGRPGEHLEGVILRGFQVLECLGNLILKPFTPTPGSAEHHQHAKYLASIRPENLSPHFFPFAELNSVTREEYHDLYRMAAFLNEKIRNRSFDFLNGTLGAQLLRESLRREVWKLESSPLSVID